MEQIIVLCTRWQYWLFAINSICSCMCCARTTEHAHTIRAAHACSEGEHARECMPESELAGGVTRGVSVACARTRIVSAHSSCAVATQHTRLRTCISMAPVRVCMRCVCIHALLLMLMHDSRRHR